MTAAATALIGQDRPGGVPVLELEQVAKVYPGSPPVRALAGVSLAVSAGELTASWARRGRASPRCCT